MSTSGRPPEVSDEEILAVFRQSDEPVLTATEVADQLSITRRGVHDRLVDLADRNILERKDVGPRAVWWLPERAVPETTAIPDDDPFFSAPMFASGTADVSENVDEYLAAASYEAAVADDE